MRFCISVKSFISKMFLNKLDEDDIAIVCNKKDLLKLSWLKSLKHDLYKVEISIKKISSEV